ncbi:4-oxalocrotonate tautomerase [Acidovorax delafieldii 2AN]|uniref:4-oxalocrotonate tautomerase n=1 Tax=Acidovorax delafieldii 2AN TaxID=573060 RepID=C5T5R3_ACIDE|nr:hypothetical protein [Acidovorax delafieldii]EER60174.1 4-oxalocrotonate tautomerase [Acidovorax delafieldii 2AN]
MPTYHIEMMEGRAIEQTTKRGAEVNRASAPILGCSPDSMDMVVTGAERESRATDGALRPQPS